MKHIIQIIVIVSLVSFSCITNSVVQYHETRKSLTDI